MQKAKVILIALFFIANLFAAYDLRFGDGMIVEVVDKLAFAEKPPLGDDNGGGSDISKITGGRAYTIYTDICLSSVPIVGDWFQVHNAIACSGGPNALTCRFRCMTGRR